MFFVIVLLATSNYPAEAQVFRRGRILSFSINRNQPAPQYCPSLQNTAQEHVRFSAKNLQNQYPSFAIQDSVPTTSEHPVHQFQTWPEFEPVRYGTFWELLPMDFPSHFYLEYQLVDLGDGPLYSHDL